VAVKADPVLFVFERCVNVDLGSLVQAMRGCSDQFPVPVCSCALCISTAYAYAGHSVIVCVCVCVCVWSSVSV